MDSTLSRSEHKSQCGMVVLHRADRQWQEVGVRDAHAAGDEALPGVQCGGFFGFQG